MRIPLLRTLFPLVLAATLPAQPIAPFLTGGSDDCATADSIAGTGTFLFDNSTATTGTEGQLTTNCRFGDRIEMPLDVWFLWTAPAAGRVRISTCGGTALDTKIAVYGGALCPSSSAIAVGCSDDPAVPFHRQAIVLFNATAGNQYRIQLASSPLSNPPGAGSGVFTLEYATPSCSADDGSSETSVSLTNPGELCWAMRFGRVGTTSVVSAVEVAFGRPGGTLAPGGAATVALWDDPNDDGNLADAVLLATAATTVANPDADVFNTVGLARQIQVAGVYFVGVKCASAAGIFVAPIDLDGCEFEPGRSWIGFETGGAFDLANFSNNTLPPRQNSSIGGSYNGDWLLRAVCTTMDAGAPFCFGDGSGTACPCSPASVPHGAAGRGCPSNVFPGGALAFATGTASLSADTLVLNATDVINGSLLFYQGATQQSGGAGAVFGDGKRCIQPTGVRRFKAKTVAGNMAAYPQAGDNPISVAGAVAAAGQQQYQGWYRSANPTFCTVETFNLTNGLTVTWTP